MSDDSPQFSKKKQQQIHSINQAKWFHERHANRLKTVRELINSIKLEDSTSPFAFDRLSRAEEEIALTAFCLEHGYFNEKDIHERLQMLERTTDC